MEVWAISSRDALHRTLQMFRNPAISDFSRGFAGLRAMGVLNESETCLCRVQSVLRPRTLGTVFYVPGKRVQTRMNLRHLHLLVGTKCLLHGYCASAHVRPAQSPAKVYRRSKGLTDCESDPLNKLSVRQSTSHRHCTTCQEIVGFENRRDRSCTSSVPHNV